MAQTIDVAGSSHPPSPRIPIGDDSALSFLQPYADDSDDMGGSGRDSSGPDEAVFDDDLADADVDTQSSAGTSQHSDCDDSDEQGDHNEKCLEDDDISELPPDSRRTSCNPVYGEQRFEGGSAPVTPQKQRSPFRNPSSVRAMQLDTTPPHLLSGSRHHHGQRYHMSNNSRNSTPRSSRSFYSAAGPRNNGGRSSPTKGANAGPRKEFPLVLLHVSLLPVAPAYSTAVLESVLPAQIVQSWNLLQEKVTDTVLERGILIPHPRDDYGLLEERLLESLELRMPRILKCGHFHLSAEEETDIIATGLDQEDLYEDEETTEHGDEELDTCEDCGRRIRDGRFGTTGSGQQRWSIKVYASNGLMRAGAWGAAWHEMERVDVEVLPWLDERVKRELDLRRDEELAHAAMHSSPPPMMDEQRRREIYGDDTSTIADAYVQHEFAEHSLHNTQQTTMTRRKELPLTDLLWLYVQNLVQDRRNLAIALLSILVLFLAISTAPRAPQEILHPLTPPIAEIVTHTVTHSEPPKVLTESTATISVATTPVTVPVVAASPTLSLESSQVLKSHPSPDLTKEMNIETTSAVFSSLEFVKAAPKVSDVRAVDGPQHIIVAA